MFAIDRDALEVAALEARLSKTNYHSGGDHIHEEKMRQRAAEIWKPFEEEVNKTLKHLLASPSNLSFATFHFRFNPNEKYLGAHLVEALQAELHKAKFFTHMFPYESDYCCVHVYRSFEGARAFESDLASFRARQDSFDSVSTRAPAIKTTRQEFSFALDWVEGCNRYAAGYRGLCY